MKRDPLTIDAWREALNRLASEYDLYRPTYPEGIPEDVAFLSGLPDEGKILEVGCGTGQLTTAFAELGYEILAVEPGEALAEHARRNCEAFPRVSVEVSKLENWDSRGSKFDLVLSAQSFHLVDRAKRFKIAADLLVPGGALAIVFSYRYAGDSPAHKAMQAAYARYAPDIDTDQEKQDDPFEDRIQESGYYDAVFMTKYVWQQVYSGAEYAGLISSHASHTVLSEENRASLLDALRKGIEGAGDSIVIDYVTRLYVARRK